jgi:hypothetical protein
MEAKKKVSKKALRTLLADSFVQTLRSLELPAPSKKINKLLERASKKMAVQYASVIKKELKKSLKRKSSGQVAVAA